MATLEKKVRWHTTFGDIEVDEQRFELPATGQVIRPFLAASGVSARGYSLPLQRAVTDFGADLPFGQVAGKVKEHYGITLPPNAALTLPERHAHRVEEADWLPAARPSNTAFTLIAEVDGGMVPLRTSSADATDKRKGKVLSWGEGKLSAVARHGEAATTYGMPLNGPDKSGAQLRALADRAGFNDKAFAHCLGDGAPWIANQVEDRFGEQGAYLLDFFHVCEYLAPCAPVCAPEAPAAWLELQKNRLLDGLLPLVLGAMYPHIEADSEESKQKPKPVLECHRYLSNRWQQVDYPAAKAAGLPIGSGMVESGHRHVMQVRLKRPGAWWKENNAEAMVNLRCMRINGRWEDYWDRLAA